MGGCLGCGVCKMNGPCVQKDDFGIIRDKLVEADMIVFATPIYYFGMSGQLKNVIDRFYSIHNCTAWGEKNMLIATMGNSNAQVADPAVSMYGKMTDYLGWEDCGQLIVANVWAAGDVKSTACMRKAHEMGRTCCF